MKKQSLSSSLASGFTMIELLVVISVIGVLAVAVLSAINPIEQINKGRDTRTRSDAAELVNAVERYFAVHEEYPWNVTKNGWTGMTGTPAYSVLFNSRVAATWSWSTVLVDSAEVKASFINRVKNENTISVYKAVGNNSTMYACFRPTSQAFVEEAAQNCKDGTTPAITFAAGDVTCVSTDGITNPNNYICLP